MIVISEKPYPKKLAVQLSGKRRIQELVLEAYQAHTTSITFDEVLVYIYEKHGQILLRATVRNRARDLFEEGHLTRVASGIYQAVNVDEVEADA